MYFINYNINYYPNYNKYNIILYYINIKCINLNFTLWNIEIYLQSKVYDIMALSQEYIVTIC